MISTAMASRENPSGWKEWCSDNDETDDSRADDGDSSGSGWSIDRGVRVGPGDLPEERDEEVDPRRGPGDDERFEGSDAGSETDLIDHEATRWRGVGKVEEDEDEELPDTEEEGQEGGSEDAASRSSSVISLTPSEERENHMWRQMTGVLSVLGEAAAFIGQAAVESSTFLVHSIRPLLPSWREGVEAGRSAMRAIWSGECRPSLSYLPVVSASMHAMHKVSKIVHLHRFSTCGTIESGLQPYIQADFVPLGIAWSLLHIYNIQILSYLQRSL